MRRFWPTIFKATVSVVLIYFLFRRVGLETVITQFKDLNWLYLLFGLGCFVASNFLGALQWFLLLKSQNTQLSFIKILSYYHVGLFFNNFLIGYVGGDAFRVYDIYRNSGNSTTAVSTVFFDRFVGFVMLTTLAMVVATIWIQKLVSNAAIYTIGIVLLGWILAFLFLFNERIARRFSVLLRIVLPKMVHQKLKEIYFGIYRFRHDKKLLIRIFIIAFWVQLLRVVTHYWAAFSLGVKISPIYFFIFIPIIALVASLPISVGGIGVREQSGVTLFAQVGIPAARVAAFELLAYFIGIIASIPGGIIFGMRKEHIVPHDPVDHKMNV